MSATFTESVAPVATSSARPRPRSAPLVLAIAAGLALMAVAALALVPGVEGTRLLIRCTARASLFLFLSAFLASTAAARWPTPFTSSWLRRRRALGLGFACSHALHLGGIATFATLAPADFAAATRPAQLVAGGLAYAFIAAMAATSSDRAVAWLGSTRWRRLHTVGAWFLWASFVFTFGRRVPLSLGYLVPVAILLAAAAWRIQRPH